MNNSSELRSFFPEVAILVACILLACLFGAISYFCNTGHWFARSGSLIVLLGVVCEFRLNSKYHARWPSAARSLYLGFTKVPELGSLERLLHLSSLTAVVLGTLIWGFGDLFFLDYCCKP